MATIKVFDVNGVKELFCFSTLSDVPYISQEEDEDISDPEEVNPFA